LATIIAIILSGKMPNPFDLFLNLSGLFGFVKWDAYFSPGIWSDRKRTGILCILSIVRSCGEEIECAVVFYFDGHIFNLCLLLVRSFRSIDIIQGSME